MSNTAEIKVDGKSYELPLIEGSEQEKAIDISKLRAVGYPDDFLDVQTGVQLYLEKLSNWPKNES